MNTICPLCECELANSRHHLIPQMVWKNQKGGSTFRRRFGMKKSEIRRLTVCICRDCHSQLHQLLSERELVRYSSVELLRAHALLRKYLNFKRKRFGLPQLSVDDNELTEIKAMTGT